MTSYSNGRRAPNATRYLSNLNMLEPAAPAADEPYNLESDLALFTNAQFFDFDSGQNTDFQAPPPSNEIKREPVPPTTVSPTEMSEISFIPSDFNFDFSNTYSTPTISGFPTDGLSLPQMQPAAAIYPSSVQQSQSQQPNTFVQPVTGTQAVEKHSSEPHPPAALNLEERSRLAAEEDKRRRNTAASARFRIKKKQREQALEKSAKEMAQKVSELENHISQLETENKWLRNILLEKNENSEHIAAILEKGFPGKDEVDRVAKELATKTPSTPTPSA
ncbi:Regulatory protein cys-3 [Ceratocystis fimbriata CBS 114723]|uniref:Regulatory protein cys-3 n=1 Tax=Ceratocystis fimbriata CBS 114723 TaxID=1035309 RepID=A0A2C5X0Q3_9PEZI|nr:Regulatory protein cys-3 [Ceratocystis fimbriata CBS 114723]